VRRHSCSRRAVDQPATPPPHRRDLPPSDDGKATLPLGIRSP
jgi:hypothetical protein